MMLMFPFASCSAVCLLPRGARPLVRNRWLRLRAGRAGTVSVGWTALVFVGGGQGSPRGDGQVSHVARVSVRTSWRPRRAYCKVRTRGSNHVPKN